MNLFESFSHGVTGPVAQRVFTTVGNLPLSNAVIYDWLDELFV